MSIKFALDDSLIQIGSVVKRLFGGYDKARRTIGCFYFRCILSRLDKEKDYSCKLLNCLDLCKSGKQSLLNEIT